MATRGWQRLMSAAIRRPYRSPDTHLHLHFHKDRSRNLLPSVSSFFSRYGFERGIQTQNEPVSITGKGDLRNQDSESVKTPSVASGSDVRFSASSNLKKSMRHDLALVFTCKVCETRSVKTMCRESYEKGVVVVRCGGCDNLHLIADRLGWFGEPRSVEDFLAARGEDVRKGNVDSLSLTLEDLAAHKP